MVCVVETLVWFTVIACVVHFIQSYKCNVVIVMCALYQMVTLGDP